MGTFFTDSEVPLRKPALLTCLVVFLLLGFGPVPGPSGTPPDSVFREDLGTTTVIIGTGGTAAIAQFHAAIAPPRSARGGGSAPR